MTATAEQQPQWVNSAAVADFEAVSGLIVRARDGHRMILRGMQRLFGASLIVSVAVLWILPYGTGGTAELLCKLAVTLVLAFAGAALWQAGSPKPRPELEIDMVRREVRLVRTISGQRSLVTRRRFQDLSVAEFSGRNVRLFDRDEALLADVIIPSRQAVRSLSSGLQHAGVITRRPD